MEIRIQTSADCEAITETTEIEIIDSAVLIRDIDQAWRDKRPLSIVRKGDGENIFISYGVFPQIPRKRYRKKLKHFNILPWDQAFQLYLRSELVKALNSCDYLGISKPEVRHGFWSIEENLLNFFLLDMNKAQFCDMNFHLELIKEPGQAKLRSEAWENVLRHKRIGLVSHRDPQAFLNGLDSQLAVRYDLPRRRARFHFMTRKRFDAICRGLTENARNVDIWLLAAGMYSLIFANKIREMGGIAIDIGSSVDTWADDYSTRGIHRKIAAAHIQKGIS